MARVRELETTSSSKHQFENSSPSSKHQFENSSLSSRHQFENSSQPLELVNPKNYLGPVRIPKPIFQCFFSDNNNDTGYALIDTGASSSLIHKSALNSHNHQVVGKRTRNYCGAGGNTLQLSDDVVNVKLRIRDCGPIELHNVVVCEGGRNTNTVLIGGPDITRLGLLLDYNDGTILIKRGQLRNRKLKMPTVRHLTAIDSMFDDSIQIMNDMARIGQNLICPIYSTYHTYNNDDIHRDLLADKITRNIKGPDDPENHCADHDGQPDVESVVGIHGEPCCLEKDTCSGCSMCINHHFSQCNGPYNLPPIKLTPGVDNKTVLLSYIERIRQKDRTTYTHDKVTFDPKMTENDPELTTAVKNIIENYKDVFSSDVGCLGPEYTVRGTIKDNEKLNPQRPGHNKLEGDNLYALLKQVSILAAHDIIRPCHDYNIVPKQQLMMLVVKKKDDDGNVVNILSNARIVVDCIPVNKRTKFVGMQTDNLPNALTFAVRASSHGYNMKCDVSNAFYIIPLDRSLWPYFCINIPILGLYCFTRVVQGWAPAAQICQDSMTRVFFQMHDSLEKYMDDLIVSAGPCKSTWLKTLDQFFRICRKNGIKLKGSKCFLHNKEFKFLGHHIIGGRLRASPHYVLRLKDVTYTKLKTKTDLRSFLCSVRYLAKFQNHSSDLLKPLNDVAKGSDKDHIEWTQELVEAFHRVKMALDELHELHPFDPNLPSVLVVDTSKTATGGFLYQIGPDGPRLIGFFSRTRNDKERKILISSCHIEFLGLKAMVYAFMPLLSQSKNTTTIVTDSRGVVKIFERYRRGELPTNDIPLNNALYAIVSIVDAHAVHARATNDKIKFADDMSRLGIFVSNEPCVGAPECTICAAADPDHDNRKAIIALTENYKYSQNIGNIFGPAEFDDVAIPSNSDTFRTMLISALHPAFNAVLPTTKQNLTEFLNNIEFILNHQLSDKTYYTLYKGLQQGVVSYPKSKQKLQTLLQTRRARIEGGYIKIDKIIDGVIYRVVPLPVKAVPYAISAVHNTIGHTSTAQLFKHVQRYFHFDNLKTQVRDFSNWCAKCVLHQGNRPVDLPQKPTPLPKRFFETILCDEVTRTFRGVVIKMVVAIEAMTGFMMVVVYDKTMTGQKFIQILTHIKVCLCPHSLDATKVTVRCDSATWHKSPLVTETLRLLNIDILFHQSTTNSKNIIPELDARIKIFSRYLVQLVEDTPYSPTTCCHLAAAKANNTIGFSNQTPAELFVGRGWFDGRQITVDVDKLLDKIKLNRSNRRLYEDRKNALKQQQNEQKFRPYKNPTLNSPLITKPELTKMKIFDLITIKEPHNKNEPKYTYRVEKIDFRKELVYARRESSLDKQSPDGKWYSFRIIERIFPQMENNCLCDFTNPEHETLHLPGWDEFIASIRVPQELKIISDIPDSYALQSGIHRLNTSVPDSWEPPEYPVTETCFIDVDL